MGHDLLVAMSLVLVLEGLLPFISPDRWRDAVTTIARMPGRQIRITGLVSMLAGTALLYFINH